MNPFLQMLMSGQGGGMGQMPQGQPQDPMGQIGQGQSPMSMAMFGNMPYLQLPDQQQAFQGTPYQRQPDLPALPQPQAAPIQEQPRHEKKRLGRSVENGAAFN